MELAMKLQCGLVTVSRQLTNRSAVPLSRSLIHYNKPTAAAVSPVGLRRKSSVSSQRCDISRRLYHVTNVRHGTSNLGDAGEELDEMEGIIGSRNSELTLPTHIPVHEFLMDRFSKFKECVALVDGSTGREITFAALQSMITKVANSLAAVGFRQGSVATLFSANCPEYIIIYLAISSVGGTISTVNPAYTPDELVRAIDEVGAEMLITTTSLLSIAQPVSKKCPSVKHKILLDIGGKADEWRPFNDLLDTSNLTQFETNQKIDCMNHSLVIPFSSGTTGLPKGVVLTHYNVLSNLLQSMTPEVLEYRFGEDCIICVLPMYHIYGQVPVSLVGLASGVKVVTLSKFDPALYLETIQKTKATVLHVVPPIMLFLAKHPMVAKYDLRSVRDLITAAAPCGVDLMQEVGEIFNDKPIIRQGYGMTETSPVTHINDPNRNKSHTVGTAVRNTQFKVISAESGKTLGPNENGEILIRGPQIMKGYYKNAQATSETIVDGWLHTGDIGHYDEEGYLVIVDRIKELIKVKGLQVAPAELEALLLSHNSIADVAVVGKKDVRLGEAPTAFVVLKSGQHPSEQLAEQLKSFVAKRVTSYKQLSGGIHFRKEIPKSPSGKILRRFLRDELNSSLN